MILKDELFNRKTVSILGEKIKEVYSDFNLSSFVNKCVDGFYPLELKERMTHVEQQLEIFLPNDYMLSLDILSNVIASVEEPMFIYGSVLEYIQVNGCTDQYVDVSLEKLGEFTFSLSAEFAIREFLNQYPDKTLDKVLEWTKSEDVHRRRLASEGTRPSLPWAPKITVSYLNASVPLDYLYYDTQRYVTRSVANHLNDISKIDPEFVLAKLRKWKKSNKQTEKEMTYIINHSLRTLIKKGHPGTLELLGYKLNPSFEVSELTLLPEKLFIGETLSFEFTIYSKENVTLIIDYIIEYPTKHNRTTQKTYKLCIIDVINNKKQQIKGRRSFKELSTRKMKPGKHQIKIQVNGSIVITKDFTLEEGQ